MGGAAAVPVEVWLFLLRVVPWFLAFVGALVLIVLAVVWWKKGRLPLTGDSEVKVVDRATFEAVLGLAQSSTEAVQALRSLVEDNKSISVSISESLGSLHVDSGKALSKLDDIHDDVRAAVRSGR